MSVPTVVQSGATSSAATSDEWLPTGAADPATTPEGPGSTSGTGSPRIVLETSEGHRVVLTYEDLVLGLLLVALTAEMAGRLR